MNRFPGRKAFLPILLFVLSAAFLGWSAEGGAYRILILGDSLTEGYGVEKEDAFPALLQARLREGGWGPRIEVVNGGSSGSTSASGVRRLKWYAKTHPDLVILALGSNDGLRGVKVEETRRNIEAAIAFCKEKGWKAALTGLEVPPNYGAKYAGEFRRIFPELAEKHGLPLHGFLLAGVAGEAEMNIADGIHPNERGHARIAENLLAFLKPMLPGKGG
jgi:acyl-CoA thioesterase-1